MNKLKYLTLLLFVSLAACAGSPNHSDSEGEVIVLNKADFLTKVFDYEKNPSKWTYEGDKPCIIDFYADWCGPCRRVAPVLKELAKRYKDDIVIYKINVDKERELAGTFGVSSIPMILFVPMKGEPQVSMGALPEESFVKMIEEVLLEKKKQ
ncbi:thioredoxin [Tannerella sp. oral taxon 808]|nr:thioredoxin [Tannerella sp. oral taxon 808]